ncbi:Autophagy-related protein 18h [Thalictrum thalictroides]|uniref:Autophagy-related protein 18h n=1 Tax=Thalictrum thalictroides TaxID=46969 RepID=A0A7J6W819_THATH|nr:Autophagy-related protein 18h [Thalictrum thalictroides]
MRKGKNSGGSRSNGLLPNSLRIISSCLKTVSTNASSVASTVRSAGASVASSISSEEQKDQVLWAGFDKLELGPFTSKNVLLLGYANGFQVLDVEDGSNVSELVSKRDGPVTFLQMQPIPAKSEGHGRFIASQPLLVVVAGDETNSSNGGQMGGPVRENIVDQPGNCVSSPTAVRFYSLRSHSYVHVLRFRSSVYMLRCSPQIIAVGLAAQIYCFDSLTLESKFSVLTYPVPQGGGQGVDGVNIGYGPMAVGPRWLAYASNNPLSANMGRLSPQNLTPSPGASPSTSPSSGSLVARYAMESSKQLAAGIINLGDVGYKKLSKYCQELLPDGSSSPVSSNSSLKYGRLSSVAHPTETDNAGMVVIKDFVSRTVISQFRAHTSPISALSFDPSGTLLVTASVYGNNINIFRIMPSCIQNGSGISNYDWSSSHVHLYKLYRGITTAVIQDICFSHYSQWVAIVSAKGTCHVFVLSPFGGDTSIQTQIIHSNTSTLLHGLSSPWWSTTSLVVNQQTCLPPPPVTLSVISRIKNGNSGWRSVSNAVSTGKASTPTGVVAVAFHNCIAQSLQPIPLNTNALEHLLVYTPCGHLVQHEFLPSLGVDPSGSGSRTAPSPLVHAQDEESRVKVEPVQWWYVCRRLDWPEREECVSGNTHDRQGGDIMMAYSDCEDNGNKYLTEFNSSVGEKGFVKSHERPHWYLSNAEVQISSGRIPIWQKSKISFHVMISLRANERTISNDCNDGECEIEKVPVHEVTVKRKDLLPVFDQFHSIKADWDDRAFIGGRYSNSFSYGSNRTKDKFKEETVSCHSKPVFVSSVESDAGYCRSSERLLEFDPVKCYAHPIHTMKEIDHGKRECAVLSSGPLGQCTERDRGSSVLLHFNRDNSQGETSCVTHEVSSPKNNTVSAVDSIAEKAVSLKSSGKSEHPNASTGGPSSSLNTVTEVLEHVDSHDPLDFGQYFQEEYCKASELDESRDLTEVADADSSSSHCEKEKPEEDEECDDMLGGVFAFSEEG